MEVAHLTRSADLDVSRVTDIQTRQDAMRSRFRKQSTIRERQIRDIYCEKR